MTEAIPLSGSALQADSDPEAGRRSMHVVQRARHQPKSSLAVRVRTWMQHQAADAERLASTQFLGDGLQAPPAYDRVLGGQIDEVASMSDGGKPGPPGFAPERTPFLVS